MKKFRSIALIVLLFMLMISVVSALAAANIVPVTHLTDQNSAVTISELAPPECASIRYTLETIIVCSGGICTGSNANELVLGTSGNDSIDSKNGDDCIVGGDGDDSLAGDNGDDVLVGGPGIDILDGGKRNKDTDICADSPGSTFIDCELIQ